MCDVPSWIRTTDGAVLYVADADAKRHGIQWNDATGHHAIRKIWPTAEGTEGEGLGKDTPPEVVQCLLAQKMNSIAAAGKVLVCDGVWNLPIVQAGHVAVYEGATLRADALTKAGYVAVHKGATRRS